jgi:hypothetical protein
MALLEPGFTVTASQPRVVGRVMLDADPAVDQAVDAALAAAGWEVVPIELAGLGPATSAAMTVLDAEAWASDGELTETAPEQIGRDVLNRLRQAAAVTPAQLSTAWDEAARWRASLSALWDQVDLLALPTLLGFPPTLGNAREMLHIRGITAPVNLAGVPALALPVPSGGPLPASVQLIGPANGEERLLAAGAVVEQAVQDLSGLAAGRVGSRWRCRQYAAAGPLTVMAVAQLPAFDGKVLAFTPRYSSPLVAVIWAAAPTSTGAPEPIRAISDQHGRTGAGNWALWAGKVVAGVHDGSPAGLSPLAGPMRSWPLAVMLTRCPACRAIPVSVHAWVPGMVRL